LLGSCTWPPTCAVCLSGDLLTSSPFCRDLIKVSNRSSASVVDLVGLAARAKDGLEVDLLVSKSCLLPCDEESDLLLADTGQEAAVFVEGVASCVLGLVVLLVVLGLVVLLLLGVALRVAEMLVAMFVSDLGEVHGEEDSGRTRAGLGAESRAAGSTVATLWLAWGAACSFSSICSLEVVVLLPPSCFPGSPWRFFSLST